MKQTLPKYKYDLVEIQWMDAVTHNGWLNFDEIQIEAGPSTTMTVAFLIKEDDKAYYLASTYHDVETNAQITVPKGMLISIRVLKKVKSERRKTPKKVIITPVQSGETGANG